MFGVWLLQSPNSSYGKAYIWCRLQASSSNWGFLFISNAKLANWEAELGHSLAHYVRKQIDTHNHRKISISLIYIEAYIIQRCRINTLFCIQNVFMKKQIIWRQSTILAASVPWITCREYCTICAISGGQRKSLIYYAGNVLQLLHFP